MTVLANGANDRVSIREILSSLQTRAFALVFFVLGLPNCLPMPPPIPLICGFLLLALSVQMVAGLKAPWFPKRLARQSVALADIQRAVARSLPIVLKLERWSQPRFSIFATPLASRLVGVILLVLSAGLVVAAPFVGQIPMGVAICLVSLGLVERDGLLFFIGVAIGLLGLALSVGFVLTIVTAIGSMLA